MKTSLKHILKEGCVLTPKLLNENDVELMKQIEEVNRKQQELEELKKSQSRRFE